jgi:hypothetical protein
MRYSSINYVTTKRNVLYCFLAMVISIAGCTTPNVVSNTDSMNKAQNQTEIRPGAYCRIDMSVPKGSSQPYLRYAGRVLEVTDDELVMANAIEESRIDDGKPMRQSVPYLTNRGTMHIPRGEIAAIQFYNEP